MANDDPCGDPQHLPVNMYEASDAVVVIAKDGAEGDDCSPLADVEEGWFFPAAGDSAPLGRDADGNVHEPGPGDLYAVLLRPTD